MRRERWVAKDQSLHRMAVRIRARAIRRLGELLQEVEPQQGKRTDKQPRDGSGPKLRKDAASDAGITDRQRKTALRVASLPKREFDAAVESDTPPSITRLSPAMPQFPGHPGMAHFASVQHAATSRAISGGCEPGGGWAGGWATAAVVWAWTEPAPRGQPGHRSNRENSPLGISEFASLSIRGLSDSKSVRKYRNRWQRAIDRGWAVPTLPGARRTKNGRSPFPLG